MTAITQAELARRLGCSPGWVTAMKQSGRLVMTGDGKRVDYEATLRRIEETADPGRDDLRSRWARRRKAADAPAPETPDEDPERVAMTYQQARAVKERYQALAAKAEYGRMIGTLTPTSDVVRTVTDIATYLRASLEPLAETLAPQLAAETDRDRVYAQLREHIEHSLGEMARRIGELKRGLGNV